MNGHFLIPQRLTRQRFRIIAWGRSSTLGIEPAFALVLPAIGFDAAHGFCTPLLHTSTRWPPAAAPFSGRFRAVSGSFSSGDLWGRMSIYPLIFPL
ncbi:hypothetical protein PSP6_250140 [Paraburkholderia tropica]|uniref:hypothetical protein n=1 Tax=Paraburkholderia tropica TaxID=92647 RepID=UPI001CB00921|nr:hypothetical protein [Paraburkholderia tropica]CAG9206519.1 hypothetical protein PSP6_250140 [Paraburkholderia tropica]